MNGGLTRDQIASLICGFIEIASALHEKELNPASLPPSAITDILREAANICHADHWGQYLRDMEEKK